MLPATTTSWWRRGKGTRVSQEWYHRSHDTYDSIVVPEFSAAQIREDLQEPQVDAFQEPVPEFPKALIGEDLEDLEVNAFQ